MGNINPYQTCPVCKGTAKVVFTSAGESTLRFDLHYKPGTTTECSHTGLFVMPRSTRSNGTPVSVMPEVKNNARKKCPRCWQNVRLTGKDGKYKFVEHMGASKRARCPGSELSVQLP